MDPDVRLGLHRHPVAWSGLAANRDLIGHRPRRNVHRVLLAEQLGDPPLEGIDRRIVAEDVVSDLGARHGGSHRLGWAGDRV